MRAGAIWRSLRVRPRELEYTHEGSHTTSASTHRTACSTKMGITNLTVWERHPNSLDRARITILREWQYEVGADGAVHENPILQEYEAYG